MKSVELTEAQIKRFFEVTDNLRHEAPHQYERVRIRDGSVVFILYNSNKLVYNENEKNIELLGEILSGNEKRYDNPVKEGSYYDGYHEGYHDGYEDGLSDGLRNVECFDDLTYDDEYYEKNGLKYDKFLLNYQYTIGSDETGKGEWYGPLVVTAVCTSNVENSKLKEIGVKDSKKITREEIPKIYKKIEKLKIKHESIILKPYEYNKLYNQYQNEGKNLNHLLADTHSQLITKLINQTDSKDVIIIVDKFDEKKMNQSLNINPEIRVIQEQNGEKYIPVATSSIIAKYHYEKTLKEIEEKYNINLRKTIPYKIDRNLLEKVCKTHFKNVNKFLKKK